MHGAMWIAEGSGPVTLVNNVVFEAYDKSAIQVSSTGNTIVVRCSFVAIIMSNKSCNFWH